MLIGVVRRVDFRVRVSHIFLRCVKKILDCRIRLKRHIDFEPLEENLRDNRSILLKSGLFLNKRRQSHQFENREIHFLSFLTHLIRQLIIEIPHHHLQDRFGRRPRLHLVSVGEQEAFRTVERLPRRLHIPIWREILCFLQKILRRYDTFALQPRSNLTNREPLRDREAEHRDFAADQHVQCLPDWHIHIHMISARFEFPLLAAYLRNKPKFLFAADDAALLKHFPDAARRHARLDGYINAERLPGLHAAAPVSQ